MTRLTSDGLFDGVGFVSIKSIACASPDIQEKSGFEHSFNATGLFIGASVVTLTTLSA